jgi:GNAT superfamily N-acetyltransferase
VRSELAQLELTEAAACGDLLRAVSPDLAARLGAAVHEIGGATCTVVEQLASSRMLNRVVGLGVERAASEADVDRIVETFQGHGVDYQVALAPHAHPPQLEGWLRARGLRPGYAWAKFARGVEAVPHRATELRVEPAGPEHGPVFGRVVAAGFGMPDATADLLAALPARSGWWCYLAYAGDEPAAAGGLYAHDGAGWLGVAATLPAHRGRGAQGALLAARIRRAVELGCRLLTTETGVPVDGRPGPSYRNLLRHGFQLRYDRPNLVPG